MPKKRDLLLKVVREIVRPVVVPEPQPAGDAVADLAKAFADTWRIGSKASNRRFPRLAACRPMHSVVQ